jgi:hypothetical protein
VLDPKNAAPDYGRHEQCCLIPIKEYLLRPEYDRMTLERAWASSALLEFFWRLRADQVDLRLSRSSSNGQGGMPR